MAKEGCNEEENLSCRWEEDWCSATCGVFSFTDVKRGLCRRQTRIESKLLRFGDGEEQRDDEVLKENGTLLDIDEADW